MSSFIDSNTTMRALQFTLDGLSKRAQVATNNVVNANTPNFKASQVTFQASLRQALTGNTNNPVPLTLTDGADINPDAQVGQAAIVETPLTNLVLKNDGNNVDIEREMTTLAETNIMYDAVAQFATDKLGILRAAVNDLKG